MGHDAASRPLTNLTMLMFALGNVPKSHARPVGLHSCLEGKAGGQGHCTPYSIAKVDGVWSSRCHLICLVIQSPSLEEVDEAGSRSKSDSFLEI